MSRPSSMRAPFSQKGPDKVKKIKYKAISNLHNAPKTMRKAQVATGLDGTPIKAGSFDELTRIT